MAPSLGTTQPSRAFSLANTPVAPGAIVQSRGAFGQGSTPPVAPRAIIQAHGAIGQPSTSVASSRAIALPEGTAEIQTRTLVCDGCGLTGHERRDYVKASYVGDIAGCLLCNEVHSAKCPVSMEGPNGMVVTRRFWQTYWGCRIGKPPARLPFCIYKEALRQARRLNWSVDQFLRRFGRGVVPTPEAVLRNGAPPIVMEADGPSGLIAQIQAGTAPDLAYSKHLRNQVQAWTATRLGSGDIGTKAADKRSDPAMGYEPAHAVKRELDEPIFATKTESDEPDWPIKAEPDES
ncbi:hypothetical protein GQ53DRAFT_815750 [Thozetella sp. PMI_491]|nr:hypothetical protein GQ53DRAFT_815750 [Thozetella sp. PMI_491]